MATTAAAQTTITIGVRRDARPFSYVKPTNPESWGGYVVDVCKHVLEKMKTRANFDYTFKPVNPSTRFEELSAGDIQILCDPATIDEERVALPNVLVSQPIYLSGIGNAKATKYPQWRGHWPCVGPVVGVVEGTTARSAIVEKMATENRFGVTFSQKVLQHRVVNAVTPSPAEEEQFQRCASVAETDGIDLKRLTSADAPGPVIKTFEDHVSLAEAVCTQRVLYSVGDLEIIAEALIEAKKRNPECKFEIGAEVASEERYGIFLHVSDDWTEADRLAIAFLRQLSIEIHQGHESVLIASFRDNFDASKVSRTLDQFFWNVVAGGN
jgi:ABC-type amino acid transport substrate-binding protein